MFDLIEENFYSMLIINQDPKFLSKFWKALFEKLRVKLLYSIRYYLQTDNSSECTNQTVEIALQFFVHALKDLALWLEILPRIHSIFSNTSSSTTNKMPNEIPYGFFSSKSLNLFFPLGILFTFQTHIDATDTILFALPNQKAHYY